MLCRFPIASTLSQSTIPVGGGGKGGREIQLIILLSCSIFIIFLCVKVVDSKQEMESASF